MGIDDDCVRRTRPIEYKFAFNILEEKWINFAD